MNLCLDIDLPKKSSEIGLIRRMFLDPSASHLIITTTLGENYYLHTQSRQPKHLPRLKGVQIESIAWNPSLPTASTREILIGASDGAIYEAYIEPASEFYRRDERYVTQVYQLPGSVVTGLWMTPGHFAPDVRHVIISTHDRLLQFTGRVARSNGPIFIDYFQHNAPTTQTLEGTSASAPSTLAVRPEPSDHRLPNDETDDKPLAWLSSNGVLHGTVQDVVSGENTVLGNSKMLPRSMFPESVSARGGRKLIQDPITAMTMSEWHIIVLVEGRVMAVNRLSGEIVFDQAVLEPRQASLGLFADLKKCTYWLITADEIFEIAASDESRDIWKTLLKENKFEAALRYARGSTQKDAVATASGDYLAKKGQYLEAAAVWGKSSKNFEEVCLTFLENENRDALRKYLQAQLATLKKSNIMQRMLIASWLVETYMSKLNELSDSITTTQGEDDNRDSSQDHTELEKTRSEFREFVTKYKADLDPKTVYDIIGSHGREEELLFFATVIDDSNFVLSYWIQREKWEEALNVLKKQNDHHVFYKYSTVLAVHTPTDLVDILMRHVDLDPERLIPALLAYNKKNANVPLNMNQAVRYLNFIIANHPSPSAAVHDTLISIYVSHPSQSEAALLKYLASQPSSPPPYDADFALRLCIQHNRVQSCVHIYSAMGQYTQAVELALKNDDIELAALIADRPEGNDKLRKKLWLLVAEKKIRHSGTGVKESIQFLRRCELLRIEDLIPFFPDFVVVDDFKDEICTALEDYSRHIDSLRQEMDNSARSAEQIRNDIEALSSRYVIVEPGEKCWICSMPLLSRQFFVFPCQHAFHSDCLGKKVLDAAGKGKKRLIKDLQAEMNRTTTSIEKKEQVIEELDGIIAEAW